MITRFVNVMFVVLFLCTLLLGLYLLEMECAADGFTAFFTMIFGSVLASVVFGCQYFWWRSTLLLVSCADEKPVVIGLSMASVLLSAGILVYLAFDILHRAGLPFSYALYAFLLLLIFRFIIWIQRRKQKGVQQ